MHNTVIEYSFYLMGTVVVSNRWFLLFGEMNVLINKLSFVLPQMEIFGDTPETLVSLRDTGIPINGEYLL